MTFFAEQVAPETSHPDTSHAGSQLGSSHLPSATHQKTYTIGFRSSQSNPAVLILDNNKSRPRRRRSTAGATRTRRRDAAEQRPLFPLPPRKRRHVANTKTRGGTSVRDTSAKAAKRRRRTRRSSRSKRSQRCPPSLLGKAIDTLAEG